MIEDDNEIDWKECISLKLKVLHLFVENTKFLPNDLNLKFKNQMMVCKSYEMDQELSLSLLKKHNGDLQKVLFDYYSKKILSKGS